MRRIAIAALLALSGALFAQLATIETAFALQPSIAPTLSATTVTVGTGVSVNAGTVVGDGVNPPTGTLTFHVDGADHPVTVTDAGGGNGAYVAVPLGTLAVGSHPVTFDYAPDDTTNYEAVSGSVATVTVNQATPTVTATPSASTVTFPNTITVSGSVTGVVGPASGTVTIRDGATALTTATLNGAGNYTSSPIGLGLGGHTISAHYNGEDADYTPGDSGSTGVTVNQPATTITFSSGATTTYGAAYSVAGTVASGAGTPGGSVSVSVDGGGATAAPLDGGGKFSLALGLLTRAAHSVKVDYAANGNFSAASATLPLTVNKAPVTVAPVAPTSAFPGQTIPVPITVAPTGTLLPGVAPLTGTVTAPLSDGPKTLAAGAATVTLNPITHNVSAAFTYSGDNNYAAAGATTPITFTKYSLKMTLQDGTGCTAACPVVVGFPAPLKAVLAVDASQPTPPANIQPSGTVHFSDTAPVGTTFWTPGNATVGVSGAGPWTGSILVQITSIAPDTVTATYSANDPNFTLTDPGAPLQLGVPNTDHNTRYIFWTYHDLLGRSPDAAGSAFWIGQLNSGVPRPAVATSLVNSNEYRGDVIAGMYQQFLQRNTDSAGLNFWVGRIAAGMTFEQFELTLLASPEYFNMPTKGKGNNTDFVKSMYQDVLGRSVDSGGLQYFTGLLTQGVPRWMVVSSIVLSTEHLQTTVNGYYQHFLNRNSDPAGLNFWVSQLQRGARDETIIALIVGSAEYFSLV